MILHIGNDEFIPLSSIVAVLDVQKQPALVAQMEKPQNSGAMIQRIGSQRVKSVVVTAAGTRCVFFLSPISAQTLRKRVNNGLA